MSRFFLEGLDGRGGAVQFDPDDAHDPGTQRLCLHGGQRGHLRHLSPQFVDRAADVHQSEPADRSDCLVHYGLAAVRRGTQRRPNRVPDEPGAVPANPLPAGDLCADAVGRESLSRAAERGRNHLGLLRAQQSNGQGPNEISMNFNLKENPISINLNKN
jgi:hypothetical protein